MERKTWREKDMERERVPKGEGGGEVREKILLFEKRIVSSLSKPLIRFFSFSLSHSLCRRDNRSRHDSGKQKSTSLEIATLFVTTMTTSIRRWWSAWTVSRLPYHLRPLHIFIPSLPSPLSSCPDTFHIFSEQICDRETIITTEKCVYRKW